MKVLFWLYKSLQNKKGLCPIMMRLTTNGTRTNFPTQVNVEERAWDHDRQQVKGNDDLTRKYNQHLLNMKTKAWELLEKLQNSNLCNRSETYQTKTSEGTSAISCMKNTTLFALYAGSLSQWRKTHGADEPDKKRGQPCGANF